MKGWTWLMCGCTLAPSLWAAEQPRAFLSPRSLGRGDTGLASYDTVDSAHINPALLKDSTSSVSLRFMEMEGFVGKNSVNTVSELFSLANVSDGLGYLRGFDSKFGKRQYLRGQLTPVALRIKNFEIAPFVSNGSWLELRDPTTPQASFLSDTIGGLQASLGLQLPGNVSAGFTVKGLGRAYFAGNLAFTDIFEFTPPSQTKFTDLVPSRVGTGYGADLGLLWQARTNLRLGLTVMDLGDTSFTSSSTTDPAPPALQQQVNLGAHLRSKLGTWDLDTMIEAHDLVNRQATNLLRHLNLGTELARSLYGKHHDIGLTAGLQEGYFTGGAFADLWVARLELANYALEIGEGVGQRIDRRWALSLQTSLSF